VKRSPPIPAQGMALRVGVLGLGAVAQAVHLPLLARQPERFRVAAICDLSTEIATAMGERYGVPRHRRFADLGSMLAAGGLDALLVLSSGRHSDAAIAGLDAGLAVFCEKPLAYTLHEIAAMRRAAQANPRIQLGYMKLHDPAFGQARTLLEGREARSVEVTVLHPTAEAQLTHARVLRPLEVPLEAVDDGVAGIHRLEKAALGEAAAERFGRLYSGILLGSIVHDLALIRVLVGDPLHIYHAAAWPDGSWPPSVEIVGLLPDEAHLSIRWHYLARYPAYREELTVHHEAGSVRLAFPSPYLLHAPTVLTHVEADGSAERTSSQRSTVEAFDQQLTAFWRMAVEDATPPAGIDQGEADIRTCQRIASQLARRASIEIGGEAAEGAR